MKRTGVEPRRILKISEIRAFLRRKKEKNNVDRDLSLILEQSYDDDIMLRSNVRQFSEYVHQHGLCYEGAVFEQQKYGLGLLKCSVVVGSEAHNQWASKELTRIDQELRDSMDYSCSRIAEFTKGLPAEALSKAENLLERIEAFKKNRRVHAKKRSLQNKNPS